MEGAVPGQNVAEVNGYRREAYESGGIRRDVYRGGDGPVVLLLHELPALSYRTVQLANRIRDHGYRIVMPTLVGRIQNRKPANRAERLAMDAEVALVSIRLCISREFVAVLQRRTSPITSWILQLARDEAAAHGQRRVGVIGMCLSGGFALAAAIDPLVGVAVVSQPGLPFAFAPFGWIPGQAADLGLSEADRLRLVERKDDPEFCVRAFRYTTDRISPAARLERIERELAPGATYTRIPAERHAHSVLSDATDVPTDPSAKAAIDQALASVIATLDERLKP
jgi:dienelactone hydrolase